MSLEPLNVTKCIKKLQKRIEKDILLKETIENMVCYLHPMELVIDPFTGLGEYQPVHRSINIPDQETFETD